MKRSSVFGTLFCAMFLMLGSAAVGAEDPMLAKFAMQLDSIEKNFWRIAPLPEEHRMRPKFSAQLYDLENSARVLRTRCIGYKDKKIPDLYNDAIMLTRAYNRFRVNSKFKTRSFTVACTGTREYQKRHNKLMREREKAAEEESGKKNRKKSGKSNLRPQLSQLDINDYSEFLDDIADKNSRKFSSWANGLKSLEKQKTAEEIFTMWQKSICDMRVNLALLAQYGKFKEENKGNVGSNNRR